jgi:8-oxo-dGTP pyrophosphatase MutT (NUDIX family)
MEPIKLLNRIRRRLKSSSEQNADAAVAIIFRYNRGDLELLLVKRAEVPGDPWSGDVAFPGGKKDRQDVDILATVFREVKEETNIDLNSILYLGVTKLVCSSIMPRVGILPLFYLQLKEQEIRINDELTSFFWVSLEKLRSSRDRSVVKGMYVPVFQIDDDVIWGLTYRIIERLLELADEN